MTFAENDIRPKSLDALRFAAREKDIAWLSSRRAAFRPSACPACNGAEIVPAYEKYSFTWARCSACRTAFMSPRPPSALLGEFYSRSELYKVWNEHIFPASQEVRRAKIFRPRLARMLALCRRHGVKGGAFFEIGAAHGIFCDEVRASSAFERVVAVEPSAAQAATCRGLGLETVEAPVEAIADRNGQADVVAAFEVIEHLAEPRAFVQSMARLLKPGGLLLLTTPNVEGFDVALLGAASETVYPEHVSLFSAGGLASIAAAAGLRELERSTPGVLDCDIVRNAALAGVIDLSYDAFLQRVLIDEWERLGAPFQAFLAEHGLSSHFWFAAGRWP